MLSLQNLIDGKLERLIKSKMTDYLGQLDDDDLVMFTIEHLKDHKPPAKLVEGLEPVSTHHFLILCQLPLLARTGVSCSKRDEAAATPFQPHCIPQTISDC